MKAILFDFDGTLANTLPVVKHAFQTTFQTFDGKSLSEEEVISMFGPSETDIIRQNLEHQAKNDAIETYYEAYEKNHARLVHKNKDIHALLRSLKNDPGLKVGIVTGKARRSLDLSLEALGMDHFFDVIITGDDVERPKPDPEGIQQALSVVKVSSDQAMFLGDSDADIEAGLAANVYTIGVQWLPEYQTADFKQQPHRILKRMEEFNIL
ncbi:HAD family hydrolase [Natribacillus halophilus]|uniref:Pyrophosphatase PpaX n=1 Tax=Natribacillus halophilus TaxID=549003 RepID=A0A1G8S8F9_9BACI|nr:HAD family hydrolase [Natribacillus halophilus]SDJ25035.1 pyrophosphatase PpaX [Natribacillus halophilus]